MVKLASGKKVERKRSFKLDPEAYYTGEPSFLRTRMGLNETLKKEWKQTPDTLYFRSRVRRKSALCAYLLVHAITRIDMDIDALRTKDMTEFLNKEYPQVIWDPVSVGKMLADLAASTEEVWKDPRVTWPDHLPCPILRGGKDSNVYYSLMPAPSTVAWFHKLLIHLQSEAEAERDDPRYSAGEGAWQSSRSATALHKAAWAVGRELINAESFSHLYQDWVIARGMIREEYT